MEEAGNEKGFRCFAVIFVTLLLFVISKPYILDESRRSGREITDMQQHNHHHVDHSKIKCFTDREKNAPICFEKEMPIESGGKGSRWSNVVIVGSFKTGTSWVFNVLSRHKEVSVGEIKKGGENLCCGPELEFFSQDSEALQGYSRYSKFFEQGVESPPRIVLEKSPGYAVDTLTPYRSALFLPSITRFIFTYRDSVETDMSLYLFRNLAKQNKIDYIEYADAMINSLHLWMECREKAFKNFIIPNSKGELPQLRMVQDLYNRDYFSPHTTHSLETALYQQCHDITIDRRQFSFHVGDHVYQAHLHAMNLRRWVHAVGKDRILCVRNDDELSHPNEIRAIVARFLDLPDEGWSQDDMNMQPTKRSR